jgi:PQQ enzyme repeat
MGDVESRGASHGVVARPSGYALAALLLGTTVCGGACNSSNATPDGGSHTPPGDSGKPLPEASTAFGVSVLEHHLHPSRDGFYTDPTLTKTAAANVKIDSGFQATVTGIIYGQPLYVDGWKTGQDAIFVATDHNHVTALNATTGAVLWDKTLGPFISLSSLPCGQPYPYYGVTSTPVIDMTSRTLYAESFQTPDGGVTVKHYLFGLSIDDGSTKAGFPVDIGAAVSGFDPTHEHDRGGLALVQGTVYIPYAGLNGDCGTYHGWVIGISTTDPTKVGAYSTPADRGGIWGSVTSDGTSAYAVTGNTLNASTWGGGEALIRFNPGPQFSGASKDYFTPSNWLTMDQEDADLGSSASVFFDVPGASPSTLALAAGKEGIAHLLNRGDLGGIGTGNGTTGEGLFSMSVTSGEIKGTPAAYTSTMGTYVVLRATTGNTGIGQITVCPGSSSGDLLAMRVMPTSPPTLVPAWCANSQGAGAPIATTTDGTSNALVWIVSAQGTNQLLAFDGDTGAPVFTGGGSAGTLGPIEHWTSPIVAKGRFFVGGENAVYALTAM